MDAGDCVPLFEVGRNADDDVVPDPDILYDGVHHLLPDDLAGVLLPGRDGPGAGHGEDHPGGLCAGHQTARPPATDWEAGGDFPQLAGVRPGQADQGCSPVTRVVHLDVEDCSEKLLRQQSYRTSQDQAKYLPMGVFCVPKPPTSPS